MAKLSSLIVALVVFMVFFAGGIALLMGELNQRYTPANYSQSDVDFYNKLDNLTSSSKRIKESTINISSESGPTDILGGFFESAYNTLRIAANSFGIVDSISTQVVDDSNIPNADIIKTGIGIIVIIIIFLGIIIGAIVKRPGGI